MKKLALILATILVVMSFPMMLMSNVSAAGVTVTYTAGGATKTTTTIADAMAKADNNTTIYITGGDYILTARESWGLKGKNFTLDLGGNTVKNADSYRETGSARIINLSYEGTTAATADNCSTITLKNGYIANTAGGCIFQIYGYQTVIFGEGIVVDQHSAGQHGIAVMQSNCKVIFDNGCVVRNTVVTPIKTEAEAVAVGAHNSWYPLVGQNEDGTTLIFEEGCFVETSGPMHKTAAGKNHAIIVNGGTLITQYKNMFVTGNEGCSLTINGGNLYNAVVCPIYGSNVNEYRVGLVHFVNWIGANGTLKITGTPKIYSLYDQSQDKVGYFNLSGTTIADGSIAPANVNVSVLSDSTQFVSHLEGASCRTTLGTMGLRFQATFEKTIVDLLERAAVAGSFKMGTMIAPKAYVDEAGEFTKEAFMRNGLTYLDVAAESGSYVDENGNTVVKAAIVNIKEANKTLDFVATAYIEWTDIAGVTHRCYTNPHPTDADARNIVEVANAALEDVKAAPEGLYTNAVVIDGVAGYARITQEQVDALVEIVK